MGRADRPHLAGDDALTHGYTALSMKYEEIAALESQYQLGTFQKMPLSIERGEGCWVVDSTGKKYLDLYGGHAVASTGHCHPEVVAAIEAQARKLIFYSNSVHNSVRAAACEALVKFAPGEGGWKVFLCNSGTEANETAMKIARRFTNRTKVISMEGSFHGRTIGSLSATALPGYRTLFAPILPEHQFCEFGKISSVKSFLDSRTAAVILEPVQSMSGVRVASPEYYQELRKATADKGTLLIADEVQTAVGRTGRPFAMDHWNVVPDLITTAKGIASGVPIGAVLVRDEIAKTIKTGEHGSTFGGGPLACAAMHATLEVLRKEKLLENAAERGAQIQKACAGLPFVEEVRGLGLILGVKLKSSAGEAQKKLLAEGVLTGTSYDPNVLRVLPPLTLSADDASLFVEKLKKTCS